MGSVAVTRANTAGPTYGFEYSIQFEPWEACNFEHFMNYGDMPTLVVSVDARILPIYLHWILEISGIV